MGEFDLSLISEFRSRPSFYDRSSPRFKDKLYNAHEWQEISNKLGFDVSILKDRILQLRNRYNLEKRRIEQLREENPYKSYDSPWPLYEHLHFLSEHIRARRSYKKMMPLNGSMGGGGSQFAAEPELSNSCSNNSNLTLRHITDQAATGGQNISAFPNGLLAVKMEDGSEDTGDETESQHNDSEINAFETAELITETHSSTMPIYHQQQQQQPQHSQLKPLPQQQQQHRPTISIRRLDTLRSDYADSTSTNYHKKQQLLQQQQQQQQQHQHQHQAQLQRNHRTSNHQSSLQTDNDSAVSVAPPPPKQARLNAREYKYTAFGNFISSSLLDLPPSTALELVERFTSDIVRVLMENAEQEKHCNDFENLQ
ncbi:putative cyclin-dependent serine/threonine-protein kinase DDB_G0272797/DDB_G0274007 [Calliphora vicina]|uniref:putative cyclin-dependent serine/threonine-protein kinase DDB_G0272797/DDB_G0274007 n=1 Tax=Calliphora vicina TaxID=7373 RepID=UPI00325A69A2